MPVFCQSCLLDSRCSKASSVVSFFFDFRVFISLAWAKFWSASAALFMVSGFI